MFTKVNVKMFEMLYKSQSTRGREGGGRTKEGEGRGGSA